MQFARLGVHLVSCLYRPELRLNVCVEIIGSMDHACNWSVLDFFLSRARADQRERERELSHVDTSYCPDSLQSPWAM